LSEVVISQSLGVEWRRKWLPIAWLATWGLAVMSVAVPYWWVIGLLAIAFWELTWQMSDTDKAPILSLGRVNCRAIQWATFAAITLFALFWICVQNWNLPVHGKVPAGKVLWSVLISPITPKFRPTSYSFQAGIASRLGKVGPSAALTELVLGRSNGNRSSWD
jgi:hypothetical protein